MEDNHQCFSNDNCGDFMVIIWFCQVQTRPIAASDRHGHLQSELHSKGRGPQGLRRFSESVLFKKSTKPPRPQKAPPRSQLMSMVLGSKIYNRLISPAELCKLVGSGYGTSRTDRQGCDHTTMHIDPRHLAYRSAKLVNLRLV